MHQPIIITSLVSHAFSFYIVLTFHGYIFLSQCHFCTHHLDYSGSQGSGVGQGTSGEVQWHLSLPVLALWRVDRGGCWRQPSDARRQTRFRPLQAKEWVLECFTRESLRQVSWRCHNVTLVLSDLVFHLSSHFKLPSNNDHVLRFVTLMFWTQNKCFEVFSLRGRFWLTCSAEHTKQTFHSLLFSF